MEREALVFADGKNFAIWDVTFGEITRHQKTCPCEVHAADGSISKGTVTFTVESAIVFFSASSGVIATGVTGQMSSGDHFWAATILEVERAEGHLREKAEAQRETHSQRDV